MQENQTYLNFTGNLSNSTYSSDLKSFVTIITITTSSFSLLGCSAIIFLYIAFNSLQQFNFQLVFYLSISILITAIGTLTVTSNDANIGGNDRTYCVLQSFLINFGGLSTIYWNMIIIYYMNALLKSANEAYVMSQKLVLFFGISLPLVLSIIPLGMHAYNYKNYICWIKYHDTKIEYLLILVEFYAPLWICFVYFIINLCCTIKKNRLKINEKCLKKYYMIKLYPISLLLCWVWGSIDIISDLSGMNYKILKILNVFFGGIQGSLNAIFFLSTNEVRHILKTQLCSMLPCFYNRKSQYKHRLHEESNESKDETDNQDKKIHEQELVNC